MGTKTGKRQVSLWRVAGVLCLFVGLALAAYPFIAQAISDMRTSAFTESYDAGVAAAGETQVQEAMEAAAVYNDNLSGNPVHDPFLEGSGMVMGTNYQKLLNLNGDGVMGHVRIPKISTDLPIYHGTSDASLASGVGHLEGSSLPIGGVGTHCVLTGHSGLVSARLFSDLDKLEEGDVFFLDVLGQEIVYEVDQVSIVEPDDVSQLARVASEDLCTLVTCTPYGVNTHRLLVRGHRTDVASATAATEETAGEDMLPVTTPPAVYIPAVMLLVFCITQDFSANLRRKRDILLYNQG